MYLIIQHQCPRNRRFGGLYPSFPPQKDHIDNRSLPDLISFSAFYDISPFGPKAQKCFHFLNERPAPHRDCHRWVACPGKCEAYLTGVCQM
jgi:hypothetical protein